MQSRSIVHQLFFAWRRTQSYIKEQTERIAANIAATEQMRQQLSKDTSSLQEHTKAFDQQLRADVTKPIDHLLERKSFSLDSADIEKVEKLHAELERQVTEVTQSDVNAEASDTMLSASGKQQQEEIVAKLENLKQLKNRRMGLMPDIELARQSLLATKKLVQSPTETLLKNSTGNLKRTLAQAEEDTAVLRSYLGNPLVKSSVMAHMLSVGVRQAERLLKRRKVQAAVASKRSAAGAAASTNEHEDNVPQMIYGIRQEIERFMELRSIAPEPYVKKVMESVEENFTPVSESVVQQTDSTDTVIDTLLAASDAVNERIELSSESERTMAHIADLHADKRDRFDAELEKLIHIYGKQQLPPLEMLGLVQHALHQVDPAFPVTVATPPKPRGSSPPSSTRRT